MDKIKSSSKLSLTSGNTMANDSYAKEWTIRDEIKFQMLNFVIVLLSTITALVFMAGAVVFHCYQTLAATIKDIRLGRVEHLASFKAQNQLGDGSIDHPFTLAIIGSGFSSLGLAVKLLDAGMRDFVMLERSDDVGGTWRDNSYPGCECDVPSHLYSFSFFQNPNWSKYFAAQPEIYSYMQECAIRFGVLQYCRFHQKVTTCEWQASLALWKVSMHDGQTIYTRSLANGQGGLSDVSFPKFDGLSTFKGEMFHSAQWDHGVKLTGKRVAVIGTGASAIQFVPHVQKVAEKIDVYCRTAPYVLPRTEYQYPVWLQIIFRHFPFIQQLNRSFIYWLRETYILTFVYRSVAGKLAEIQCRMFIRRETNGNHELIEKLTPKFRLGCKRTLMSNTWYKSLAADNASVITSPIQNIVEDGICTVDGQQHAYDVIIFGTGFTIDRATTEGMTIDIVGLKKSLAETWNGSMFAYKCTFVPNFPNFLLLSGPNIGLGNTSQLVMFEAQALYIVKALIYWQRSGADWFDVLPEVCDAWNNDLQRRLQGTVWNDGGCSSWYIDSSGKNRTIYPKFTWQFWLDLGQFNASEFIWGQKSK